METQKLWLILAAVALVIFASEQLYGQTNKDAVLKISKTSDFAIDGKGSAKNWDKTDWIKIEQRSTSKRMTKNKAPFPTRTMPPERLTTQAKVLYSDTGIYFLFRCEDRILQATMKQDFRELWWEDVLEVFLWPDKSSSTYFEYQLSPLNRVRMIEQKRNSSYSKPLYIFSENQPAHHQTSIGGGKKQSGAKINQWMAEFFIPFKFLQTLHNTPETGTKWKINLYRFDYDTGNRTSWAWQPVGGSNHNLEKFGTLLFR